MFNKKNNPIIWITIITIICKGLGFIKNSLLAYFFGTGPVVDAYVMTFAIGTITSGWIAGLIGNFTPIYKQIEINNKEKAIYFSGVVFNWLYVLVAFLVLILLVFSEQVVRFVAPGFTGETYQLTVSFSRIYSMSIVFYAGYRFFQEYLNCNQHHLLAVFPDVFMSAMCIIAIIISKHTRNSFLIMGYVFAILLEFVFEVFFARKKGFIFCNRVTFDDSIRRLLQMAFPIFLSDTLAQINILIDKIFASQLDIGTVSAMEYATTMRDFAYQVGTIAILTTIFPIFSKLSAERKINEFANIAIKAINYMTILYVPLIMGIFVLGDWVIEIVYMRGNFDAISARMTTNCFIIYCISLIALAYRCIFLKAFYALQKTKCVLIVSGINVLLNILLNLFLVRRLGYIGLTLATTLASLICLPVYFVLFKRLTGFTKFREVGIVLGKSFVASFAMAALLVPIKFIFSSSEMELGIKFMALLNMTLLGMCVYFVAARCLRVEEVDLLYKNFRSRIGS